jgi:hypothetical protein
LDRNVNILFADDAIATALLFNLMSEPAWSRPMPARRSGGSPRKSIVAPSNGSVQSKLQKVA